MNFPFHLRDDARFDIVGFGTNAVDHLVRVPGYPAFNSKVELTSHAMLPGGEIASTMVGCQRLGLSAAYAGRFGGDDAGRLGLVSLEQEQVDITYAQTIETAETQIAYIVIDEDSGERTIMWRRDAQLAYTADEAPLETARLGRVLHMTPHDTAAAIAMAREAAAAGVIVSIDIDRAFDGFDELLGLVHICIASEQLLLDITGLSDHEEALRAAADRFRIPVVGVTLGDRGSLTICEGRIIASPAFAVPGGCVDTTGAGDAYRTGFLYGVLTGASVEQCCTLANAAAALKCRALGARHGLPDRETLTEFTAKGDR